MQRTGSTMLGFMLNQHPEIATHLDEPFLLFASNHYQHKTYWTEADLDVFLQHFSGLVSKEIKIFFATITDIKQAILPHLPRITYIDLCKLLNAHFMPNDNKPNADLLIDKETRYIFYTDSVIELCPNAKYVVLVRDYRDLIVTWRKRGMMQKKKNAAFLSQVWCLAYQNVLPYLKTKDPRFLLVRYEDLVTKPEAELMRICAFLGKTYCPEMLNFRHTFQQIVAQKEGQAIADSGLPYTAKKKDHQSGLAKPVTNENVGIWKKILSDQDLTIADWVCQPVAQFFDYEPSNIHAVQSNNKPITTPNWYMRAKSILPRLYAHFRYRFWLKLYLNTPLALKIRLKQRQRKKKMTKT